MLICVVALALATLRAPDTMPKLRQTTTDPTNASVYWSALSIKAGKATLVHEHSGSAGACTLTCMALLWAAARARFAAGASTSSASRTAWLGGGPMSPKSQVCTGGSSPKCRRYSCSARWQLTL